MAQQEYRQLSDGDEEYLVNILDQVLHPSPNSIYLSGKFLDELERTDGYLELMMVRLHENCSHG